MSKKRQQVFNDENISPKRDRSSIPTVLEESPLSPNPVHLDGEDYNLNFYTDTSMKTRKESEEEEEIENEMVEVCKRVEAEEDGKNHLMLLNEKYRLLDEVIIPITKSANKLLTIGIRPLEDSVPVLRIANPQLTAGIIVLYDEVNEFLKLLKTLVDEYEPVKQDVTVGFLKHYVVVQDVHQNISFITNSKDNVYRTLYLSFETLRTVVKMSNLVISLLEQRALKRKFYPDYKLFVVETSLRLKESSELNLDEVVFEALDNSESNMFLYELAFKLPYHIKRDVNRQLKYFVENNNYEFNL